MCTGRSDSNSNISCDRSLSPKLHCPGTFPNTQSTQFKKQLDENMEEKKDITDSDVLFVFWFHCCESWGEYHD